MRAKEFLIELPLVSDLNKGFDSLQPNEDEIGLTNEQIIASAKKIKYACAPFIKNNYNSLHGGEYLYRGIKGADPMMDLIVWGNVRIDRSPRDTPRSWHEILDAFFLKRFGWAYRSSSLFVAPDLSDASDYGSVYVIFPAGEYKICYSPLITDAYTDLVSNPGGSAIMHVLGRISDAQIPEILSRYDLDDSINPISTRRDFHIRIQQLAENSVLHGFDYNFREFLEDFALPLLQYKETLTYSEMGHNEGMIKCGKYYGVKSVGYSSTNRQKALFKSIMDAILY